jgi:hypothetical protein
VGTKNRVFAGTFESPGVLGANSLLIKKVFTYGVYVPCAEVADLSYLILVAGACLHKPHDRYSHPLDPVLCDEDRDPVRGVFYE